MADGIRWLAREGKEPDGSHKGEWSWFFEDPLWQDDHETRCPSEIPDPVHWPLKHWGNDIEQYPTYLAAYLDAAQAAATLIQEGKLQ